jgi:hypothetical protein
LEEEEGLGGPRREIVRGIFVGGVGFVGGGWWVYGGGGGGGCDDAGCDAGDAGGEKVVFGWRWWRKYDGKRFGRRWIRAESIDACIVFFGGFRWVVGKLLMVVGIILDVDVDVDVGDASVGNGGGGLDLEVGVGVGDRSLIYMYL